ncbi:probable BOI-related E3 ubiquitin-protein ligase 3 [Primulina huaijiensis]|uniref:probable BOI-related E3 ubiquitin-protein ligase 3 n=1 Tax=Primulina huaijiensis TaxID=1492673 RepID=UPI003CC77EA8
MAIEAQLYSENLGFALKGPQELFLENASGFFDPQKRSAALSDHQENLNYLPDISSSQLLPKHSMKDQQSTPFSHNFSAHFEKQRMEFDQFIRIQNERLRLTLQEQRKQQTALYINKYESRTKLLLKQKEEQIAEASNITFQLENLLTRMEIENQTWQRVAKENEAMVASLNNVIQRLKETSNAPPNGADDAESCYQNIDEEKTEAGELGNMKKMVCRCCNHRNSCVIILPCRHLCSCKDCEVFLYSCPVCRNVKKATIEVLV